MATPIKGEVNILYIHDGTAYLPVACLTSNSLSITKEVISLQTKCDPGVTIKSPGSTDYEISMEGVYIDTTSVSSTDSNKMSHDKLLGIIQGTSISNWKLDTGLTDNDEYFGTGYLTGLEGVFGAGNENASFSGSISGSGSIVTVDPLA